MIDSSIAERVALKGLKRMGMRLGQGNFGTVYSVDGYVVKIPAMSNYHGEPWAPNVIEQYGWFHKEHAIAVQARARGYGDIVPDMALVVVGGIPVIVRELGVPCNLTVEDWLRLEDRLTHMEVVGGTLVRDRLDTYRVGGQDGGQDGGRIVIGDVGLWKINSKPWAVMDSDLSDELNRIRPDFRGYSPVTLPWVISNRWWTTRKFGLDPVAYCVDRYKKALNSRIQAKAPIPEWAMTVEDSNPVVSR